MTAAYAINTISIVTMVGDGNQPIAMSLPLKED